MRPQCRVQSLVVGLIVLAIVGLEGDQLFRLEAAGVHHQRLQYSRRSAIAIEEGMNGHDVQMGQGSLDGGWIFMP